MENDRVSLARNFINAILKAKKMLQIYPSNNIIYLTAVDEAYAIAKDYLGEHGDITFKMKPVEILVDDEPVYQSTGKADNLALFFFKDGIREVIFKQSLSRSELEDFLKLMGTDFEKDDSGDDFLSATWGRSFEAIKLTIDDVAYMEVAENLEWHQDGDLQESEAGSLSESGSSEADPKNEGSVLGFGSMFTFGPDMQGVMTPQETADGEKIEDDSSLARAYQDALTKEDTIAVAAHDLTPEERGIMISEMQRDPSEKSDHLAAILVAMLSKAETSDEAGMLTKALKDLILFSFRRNDLGPALTALRMAEGISDAQRQELREPITNLLSFCRSEAIIDKLGGMLDASKEFDEDVLREYAAHIGGESIHAIITLLARLESIHARRMVNNILIRLGRQNIRALTDRLKDPTWYVVRNMVYILRNIGDNAVLDDILTVAGHENPRVRLEVVKAMRDFKGDAAVQALKEFFDDEDLTIRLTAVTVIGAMVKVDAEARKLARDAVIAKIREKGFEGRDFREKKSFYETLALMHDITTDEYAIDILKKKRIFGGRKNAENRACAAHYLGLAKCYVALPLLEKLRDSSDALLREHAEAAVLRLSNA